MSAPDATDDRTIRVEVAWATPDQQRIIALTVAEGCTARQAAQRVAEHIPDDYSLDDLGVFGRRVTPDTVLQPGDRVELYRALSADPKVIRREMAKLTASQERGKARKRRSSQATAESD